ncbi:MAG: hypothetical protein WCT03_19400 [Candidatus Obscuribacterales bacterium]|jgi:hypothetical protein
MPHVDYEQVLWTYSQNKNNFTHTDLAQALEQTVLYGSLTSIFPLTGLCLHPSAEIREKAWAVIDYLLKDATGQDLVKIDSGTRCHRILVEPIKLLDELKLPTNVLGMLSFNASGYVREKALKILVTRFDGKELPFILLRANDWIDTIHHLAISALKERLTDAYANHFTENLYLIKHLTFSERYNQADIDELISKVLCSPRYVPELLNYLDSEIASDRHLALTLLLKIESSTASKTAINAGLNSKYALIRQRTLEHALTTNKVDLIERPIVTFLDDSAGAIRLETLNWLVQSQESRDFLNAALFDSSSAIRLFARYTLTDLDAKEVYLLNLKTKKHPLVFTLRGLVETEAKVKLETLEPFMLASSGKVRALAYELALAQESSSEYKCELFRRTLLDSSTACIKLAHKYLKANPDMVPLELLFDLFKPKLLLRAKRSLIAAISAAPVWTTLPYLLTLKTNSKDDANGDSDEVQEALDLALAQWLKKSNSNFTTINTTRLAQLKNALDEAQFVLSSQQYSAIKAVLNHH